jgi:hypothetical protein
MASGSWASFRAGYEAGLSCFERLKVPSSLFLSCLKRLRPHWSPLIATPSPPPPPPPHTHTHTHTRLQLLGQGDGGHWGAPGKLPGAGQYCYEALQMARYEAGQHFLAHEDGFPAQLARQNGFQRHATLLVYLNTTAEVRALGLGGELCVKKLRGGASLHLPKLSQQAADVRSHSNSARKLTPGWSHGNLRRCRGAPRALTCSTSLCAPRRARRSCSSRPLPTAPPTRGELLAGAAGIFPLSAAAGPLLHQSCVPCRGLSN